MADANNAPENVAGTAEVDTLQYGALISNAIANEVIQPVQTYAAEAGAESRLPRGTNETTEFTGDFGAKQEMFDGMGEGCVREPARPARFISLACACMHAHPFPARGCVCGRVVMSFVGGTSGGRELWPG